MVRSGEVKDYADLARLGGVSRERISQIMKLVWLAPTIQQELLYLPPVPGGNYPISELAVRGIANSMLWSEQQRMWADLKRAARVI